MKQIIIIIVIIFSFSILYHTQDIFNSELTKSETAKTGFLQENNGAAEDLAPEAGTTEKGKILIGFQGVFPTGLFYPQWDIEYDSHIMGTNRFGLSICFSPVSPSRK